MSLNYNGTLFYGLVWREPTQLSWFFQHIEGYINPNGWEAYYLRQLGIPPAKEMTEKGLAYQRAIIAEAGVQFGEYGDTSVPDPYHYIALSKSVIQSLDGDESVVDLAKLAGIATHPSLNEWTKRLRNVAYILGFPEDCALQWWLITSVSY